MESSGEKNKVHISGDVAKRLEKLGYKVTFRGTVPVKGKGKYDVLNFYLM